MDVENMGYEEIKEWVEHHGGHFALTNPHGNIAHIWGIRYGRSLCGLWYPTNVTECGKLCGNCHKSIKGIIKRAEG